MNQMVINALDHGQFITSKQIIQKVKTIKFYFLLPLVLPTQWEYY